MKCPNCDEYMEEVEFATGTDGEIVRVEYFCVLCGHSEGGLE